MRQINPLEKCLIGNVVGCSCLLLASANELYHWVNSGYSIAAYSVGMITFLYVFLRASPQMKRWLNGKVDQVLPPGQGK